MSVINTNIVSLETQKAMNKSSNQMRMSQKALSTGSRVSDPSFDPSSASVGLSFQSNMNVISQGSKNAIQAASMLQMLAENMQETAGTLSRLSTIATQANTNVIHDDEREMLNLEFQRLLNQVDRNSQVQWGASSTNKPLYGDGTGAAGTNYSLSIQVDHGHTIGTDMIEFGLEAVSLVALGLNDGTNNIDVTAQTNASAAQDAIGAALTSISNRISAIGAYKNQMDATVEINTVNVQGMAGARSSFVDADITEELVKFQGEQSKFNLAMGSFQQSADLPKQLAQLVSSVLRG